MRFARSAALRFSNTSPVCLRFAPKVLWLQTSRGCSFLTTDIQALVLGIRKECSWRKLAAGDTTVGSTPCWNTWLLATGPLSREIILEMP